jgi:hypothetical protein
MQSRTIQRLTQNFLRLASSPAAFIVGLLALCAITYGPFLNQLGFYWDDFPISWIGATMGPAGLARYFSTNRPVWGVIYQVTTQIVGPNPVTWQVIALLLRWLAGVLFWAVIRQAWPNRGQLAAWAAVLFIVYPGFTQQYIAFLYSHFFIVLNCLLGSLLLTLLAIRHQRWRGHPRWYWPLTAGALLLSAINLLAMEYFFLLDLLRPILVWIVLSETLPDWHKRLASTLKTWLPYLGVFLGVVIWRMFFFGYGLYKPTLAGRLAKSPFQALVGLVATALSDAWKTAVLSWGRAFRLPAPDTRLFTISYYWIIVAAAAVLSIVFLILYHPREKDARRGWLWQPLAVGLVALFVAGGPFWLTDLPVGLTFPNDRFALPFVFGACLLLAGLLSLVPGPVWAKVPLLGILLGFSAGMQFQNAAQYRQDWNAQRTLFWQLTWRAPDLKPGTLLLSNELPLAHYTDNSLSAPLNWIYDPENDPSKMQYILYYVTIRKDPWLVQLKTGETIQRDYLATTFTGNSSQVVAFYYLPPGCLRVLDPEVDGVNMMVPLYLRDVLSISSDQVILDAPAEGKPAITPPARLFGSEPQHGWCYYYEKAELARQSGDWETVTRLGDEGLSGSDYPNDPAERFPFIEGYALTGNWDRAIALTGETRAITPAMQAPLCRLWQRIERETGDQTGQAGANAGAQAVKTAQTTLDCASVK